MDAKANMILLNNDWSLVKLNDHFLRFEKANVCLTVDSDTESPPLLGCGEDEVLVGRLRTKLVEDQTDYLLNLLVDLKCSY